MKTQHTIKLVGMIPNTGRLGDDESVAQTHQASAVGYFSGREGKHLFTIKRQGNDLSLWSGELNMLLTKHLTLNYWEGTSPTGNKAQVSLKKIVGELRYWA